MLLYTKPGLDKHGVPRLVWKNYLHRTMTSNPLNTFFDELERKLICQALSSKTSFPVLTNSLMAQ